MQRWRGCDALFCLKSVPEIMGVKGIEPVCDPAGRGFKSIQVASIGMFAN